LHLKQIHITNFCNLNSESIDFHPVLNVIVGNNGMGKTNVLDAINYLCLTRSNFSRLDKYNITNGADFLRLEGTFTIGDKDNNVVIKLKQGAKKLVEKNGNAYERLADHIGKFPLVMIAPKDNVQILESSAERRKLLDKVLSQTNNNYLSDLISYNKLLDQRNAVLKSGTDMKSLRILLSTYDEKMQGFAENIFKIRTEFIEELKPIFSELYGKISDQKENAHIHYLSKLQQKTFLELCKDNFEKDFYLKRSNSGIHKDDIVFEINDVSVKNFASQGQLKSLVLAFKLAQFVFLKSKTMTTPIILLDDVFDKLDRYRVKYLVHLLFEAKLGQVFITDTDEQRIIETFKDSGFGYKMIQMESGRCISQKEVKLN
jgi:DNA replication and repair protein RecF